MNANIYRWWMLLVLTGMFFAMPLQASTIDVTCDAIDFQHAIDLANDETSHPGADTINLSAGCTYEYSGPAAGSTITALPVIKTNITIDGHGATIRMSSTPDANLQHLLFVENTGTLTIKNAILSDAIGRFYIATQFGNDVIGGGAIYNVGTTTIDHCTVQQGKVGAAVYNYFDKLLTVLDSTFDHNYSDGNGGAIYTDGRLIVARTTFSNNATRQINPYNNGGAIFIAAPTPLTSGGVASIDASTFTDNFSSGTGSAIFSLGQVIITYSTFTNNLGHGGGAVTNWTGDLTVTKSFFGENRSSDKGAAIYTGHLTSISNSTFWKNDADEDGGAIYGSGVMNITNSTFSQNVARNDHGDAIFQTASGTGTTKNSVFAGHTAACYTLHDGGGNIVDQFDPSCSGGFFLGDPKLQDPAIHSGKTKTMKFGAGSKALDRLLSTACPSTDQRDQARPAGDKCDIGAFEDQIPTKPGTPGLSSGSNPSKTGAFTLAWASSSDPDGPVTYNLYHQDSDDVSASLLSSPSVAFYAFSESEGTFDYYVTASDGNHQVQSSSLTKVIVDKTKPNGPTLTVDRKPDYDPGTGPSNAWYLDTVTVTITANGDPNLADGSAGSGVGSVTPSPTYNTSGPHTANGVVTDKAGNDSTSVGLSVNVDAETPVVAFTSCPATVLLKHPASVNWSASDPSSGLATSASGSIALDVATIGTKKVTATATDNVGHTTNLDCVYSVIYNFTGFFDPLLNPPQINSGSAGQVLPASFSLEGNQGLGIFAANYPQSAPVPCDAIIDKDAGTPTDQATTLVFGTGQGGRYFYSWKTSPSWRGTCRQLIVKLNDGTFHRANFKFK